jgi:hypothetical protein
MLSDLNGKSMFIFKRQSEATSANIQYSIVNNQLIVFLFLLNGGALVTAT